MTNRLNRALMGAALAATAASLPVGAMAADLDVLKVSGYIRHAVQFNLSDPEEVPGNNIWDMNMSRTTVRFDLEAELPTVTFVAIARASREVNTNYLKKLDRIANINFNAFTGRFVPGVSPDSVAIANNGRLTLVDDYLNKTDLREFYAEFDITDRISARLGKQQVAFGETDFFQANDLLHGFDFTWRAFLEAENEELRKPLTMANFTIQVPELNGKLQLIYGPGDFNPQGQFGTSLDIFGGRFAGTPNAGFSFLDKAISPYNYEHDKGDTTNDFYAARWSGYAFDINYSFMYLNQVQPDPIVIGNPNVLPNLGSSVFAIASAGATWFDPARGANDLAFMGQSDIGFDGRTCTAGGLAGGGNLLATLFGAGGPLAGPGAIPFGGAGVPDCYAEIIYPRVQTFGGTASYYDAFTDAVYSTEFAYVKDKAFQFGRFCGFCQDVSGFVGLAGAKRKDEVSIMLRADKLLYLSDYIGTHRASFFSIQAFNRWLPDFEKSDQLVVGPGFGAPKKRWETVLTAILAMNYLNDRINPTLAAGTDLTHGQAFFIIPSVNLVQGDTWRLLIEADLWFNVDARRPAPFFTQFGGGGGGETARFTQNDGLFDSFQNKDTFYVRLTRQF